MPGTELMVFVRYRCSSMAASFDGIVPAMVIDVTDETFQAEVIDRGQQPEKLVLRHDLAEPPGTGRRGRRWPSSRA